MVTTVIRRSLVLALCLAFALFFGTGWASVVGAAGGAAHHPAFDSRHDEGDDDDEHENDDNSGSGSVDQGESDDSGDDSADDVNDDHGDDDEEKSDNSGNDHQDDENDVDEGNQGQGNNDDEQPISSAAASLEPPWSTGVNAGFSRPDEALLVIIAITDEDEQPTPQANAQEVFDRLVATRGDARKMVFLGIGGASNCMGAYGMAERADELIMVTDLFKGVNRGVFWDLCAGSLEMGLDEALDVISQACDEFPGIP